MPMVVGRDPRKKRGQSDEERSDERGCLDVNIKSAPQRNAPRRAASKSNPATVASETINESCQLASMQIQPTISSAPVTAYAPNATCIEDQPRSSNRS